MNIIAKIINKTATSMEVGTAIKTIAKIEMILGLIGAVFVLITSLIGGAASYYAGGAIIGAGFMSAILVVIGTLISVIFTYAIGCVVCDLSEIRDSVKCNSTASAQDGTTPSESAVEPEIEEPEVEPERRCPVCGELAIEGAMFCRNCGSRLEE